MNGEKTIENLKKILVQILKRKILVPESYLAGGSALYFYLRHRLSIDLDFFVPKPFASEAFVFKMRDYFDQVDVEIIERETVILFLSKEKIKFSLFYFPYQLLSDIFLFEVSQGITCPLASLEDIEAMKAISLAQRGSAKDFVDLYYILQRSQHKFEDIAALVKRKYRLKEKYDYHLKTAMVYFDDAEKEINSILLTDQSGRIRSVSKKEWEEMKIFFKRFCL